MNFELLHNSSFIIHNLTEGVGHPLSMVPLTKKYFKTTQPPPAQNLTPKNPLKTEKSLKIIRA
ncbi:MAG: hypothetical protein ACO1QS_03080, partial [Verrucomicrobiota bacterium]